MREQVGSSAGLVFSGSLALWRPQYPRFAELVDGGVRPVQALRYLGLALWQDGRLGDAATVLTEAAALAPGTPSILSELGSVLWAAGRPAEALRQLTASLNLAPNQIQTWLSVAGLCSEIGDKKTAGRALRTALDLDPSCTSAAVGLGLLLVEQRRLVEAAELLGAVVARGDCPAPIYACLGQTLFQLGDFAGARTALAKAAAAFPGEMRITQKYAEAYLLEKLIDGPVVEAIEVYVSIANGSCDLAQVCSRAFQILCAYGKTDAAIRLGKVLLKRNPADPVIAYHLDALQGAHCDRAPNAYLAACFDYYAGDFDRHLIEVLDYRAPEKLSAMLSQTGLQFKTILDLGCGTGLASLYLSAGGSHLTGVDISPLMLEKARERSTYGLLVESEAIAYLSGGSAPFDLIVALDVLIYFGDLAALFAAVSDRLPLGGHFAFSFETSMRGGDFSLLTSGRFAHDSDYIRLIAGRHFEMVYAQHTTLRLEANQPVAGDLMVLRKFN
jgi:predicted TPR repeat methyltransferase